MIKLRSNMNRKHSALLAALLIFGTAQFFSCRETKRTVPDGYKLVWSDEFENTVRPDSNRWAFEYGFIRNNEKQYYTDSLKNVRIENGYLVIEAHREKIANEKFGSDEFNNKPWLKYIADTDTAEYTSGSIMTQGLAEWTYGYIEVSAKLPQGVGLWPAIWMLGTNRAEVGWPRCGEIDIMEHVGFNKDSIFGTIHTGAYNHTKGTQKGKKIFIDDPYNKFHLFALEWTPEKMDFLLDGKVYNHIENEHKTTEEWPFDQDFFLKLNVAVGGGLGGRHGIDDSVFPQKMVIDYVRVYQMK
jgi:beta-glucanase (GH16 family)